MLQIKITKGTKRVNLRLKDPQTLHISVPSYYTQNDCELLLVRYRDWITSTSATLRDREDKHTQELESRRGQILYFGEWIHLQQLTERLDAYGCSDMFGELKVFLERHCAMWAERMQVRYESVCLSNARSFFGICTHDNHLRFSRMLCFAPKSCIEYVIIHELAHIRYKNHSNTFWAFVGEFCSHYRQSRAFLRQHTWLYQALLKQESAKTHKKGN